MAEGGGSAGATPYAHAMSALRRRAPSPAYRHARTHTHTPNEQSPCLNLVLDGQCICFSGCEEAEKKKLTSMAKAMSASVGAAPPSSPRACWCWSASTVLRLL